jgi:hypothetical protein
MTICRIITYLLFLRNESGSYCSELGLYCIFNLPRGAVYMIHTFFYFLLLKFNEIQFNLTSVILYFNRDEEAFLETWHAKRQNLANCEVKHNSNFKGCIKRTVSGLYERPKGLKFLRGWFLPLVGLCLYVCEKSSD